VPQWIADKACLCLAASSSWMPRTREASPCSLGSIELRERGMRRQATAGEQHEVKLVIKIHSEMQALLLNGRICVQHTSCLTDVLAFRS
jgi:hypothetical protein